MAQCSLFPAAGDGFRVFYLAMDLDKICENHYEFLGEGCVHVHIYELWDDKQAGWP